MLFVSGAENGDADHVATLVRLADELDALGRGGGPSTGSGSSSRSSGDTGGSAGCGGTPPTTPLRLPGGQPLRFQMGLHAGPVATGILGTAALRYGVYGPTVTLARALEAASAPGVLRASDAAVRRLGGVAGAAPGSGSGSAAGLPSSAGPLEAAAAAAAAAGWLDGGDLVVAVGGDGEPGATAGAPPAPAPYRLPTRVRGRDAGLAPLAALRAAAAAVGDGSDPTARGLPPSAARAPPLAAALAAGVARARAATDAAVFGAALAGTVLYGGLMAAAGRLVSLSSARGGGGGAGPPSTPPFPPPTGFLPAVPAPAVAAACLVWAAALGAAGSPGYAGPPREALALGLRALASVPRVWRVYAGVPGLLARGVASATAATGGPAGAVGGALAAGAAVAAATAAAWPPGLRAGLAAAAPQAALAALVPVPLPAALRAAAGCAALAAAAAAGGSSGGGGWPSLDPAALLSYALLGMAAPILLQAGTGRAAMRRMLSQLTA